MEARSKLAFIQIKISVAEEILERIELWDLVPKEIHHVAPKYVWAEAIMSAMEEIRATIGEYHYEASLITARGLTETSSHWGRYLEKIQVQEKKDSRAA